MLRWRREERKEKKRKVGCKLTAGFDTRTKKPCERDKCAMY